MVYVSFFKRLDRKQKMSKWNVTKKKGHGINKKCEKMSAWQGFVLCTSVLKMHKFT